MGDEIKVPGMLPSSRRAMVMQAAKDSNFYYNAAHAIAKSHDACERALFELLETPGTPEWEALVRFAYRDDGDGALRINRITAEYNAMRLRVEKSQSALQGLMDLLANETLVRNTWKDSEPGWALKQMPLMLALKAATEALAPQAGGQPIPYPVEEPPGEVNTPTHLQPPAQKMVLDRCRANVRGGFYESDVADRDVTHLVQLVEQLQGELTKALEAALTAANSNKFPVELNKT